MSSQQITFSWACTLTWWEISCIKMNRVSYTFKWAHLPYFISNVACLTSSISCCIISVKFIPDYYISVMEWYHEICFVIQRDCMKNGIFLTSVTCSLNSQLSNIWIHSEEKTFLQKQNKKTICWLSFGVRGKHYAGSK